MQTNRAWIAKGRFRLNFVVKLSMFFNQISVEPDKLDPSRLMGAR